MTRRKWLPDALERFLWTIAQASAGVLLDQLISGEVTWRAVGYAGAITALKLIIARKVGSKDSAAIPETHPAP